MYGEGANPTHLFLRTDRQEQKPHQTEGGRKPLLRSPEDLAWGWGRVLPAMGLTLISQSDKEASLAVPRDGWCAAQLSASTCLAPIGLCRGIFPSLRPGVSGSPSSSYGSDSPLCSPSSADHFLSPLQDTLPHPGPSAYCVLLRVFALAPALLPVPLLTGHCLEHPFQSHWPPPEPSASSSMHISISVHRNIHSLDVSMAITHPGASQGHL